MPGWALFRGPILSIMKSVCVCVCVCVLGRCIGYVGCWVCVDVCVLCSCVGMCVAVYVCVG